MTHILDFESRYAECRLFYSYAECCCDDCNYAVCRYDECSYANYSYAECSYAECHSILGGSFKSPQNET
jgi:hypothetical protein